MANQTQSSSLVPDQTCRCFSLAEIRSATQDFDDSLVVGRGGFGKVYKGSINNGSTTVVAIKRLHSTSNQGAPEFRAEVEMLSRLRHCNLVSLIGYCNEATEMALVYDYMPHGTLEDRLHKVVDAPLSWLQRVKICVGAARGLDYLHTGSGTQRGVIHRDVKSSNILLDVNFAAKISDFGLAKICPINQTHTHVSTRVKGTFGYIDPYYFQSGKLTRRSDVYSFGVVLFEVLCGRQAVDHNSLDEEPWESFPTWARSQIKKGKLNQIVDPRLRGQVSTNCLKEFARIAAECLHDNPKHRPSMANVVVKLESVLALQESIDSSVDEESLFDKVWSLFTPKTKLPPAGSTAQLANEVGNAPTAESSNRSLKVFTYTELVEATGGFKDKEYDTGGVVTVYKGWIDERTYTPSEFGVGLAIYVRTKSIGDIKMDFKVEDFNHPNLAKILGYCLHNKDLLCVYEFIPNGGLDKHLYGGTGTETGTNSLSWVQRLKIAVGAAKGLCFLHRRKHMAYTQFKTSVILLDADFNARLSDFELEKACLVKDTYLFNIDAFYAAPEWLSYQVAKLDSFGGVSHSNHGYFSVKSEIYAFGVVLLEMLTGQKVYDVTRPEGKQNLVKWASPLLADKSKLGTLMDPNIGNNYSPDGAFRLAVLVSSCLRSLQENRPSMAEILQVLYDCYQQETKSS